MANYMVCIILAALASISSAMLLMLRYKINNLQKTISVLNNNIVEKSEVDKLLNILLELNEFSLKEQDSFDRSEFLNTVVNEVYKFTGVGSAAVILLDNDTNEAFISSSKEHGSIDPELEAKFELNVADIVLENCVPILVNDKLSGIATKLFQKDNSNTYKSFIAAPIKINNKSIGVLTVVALPNGRIFNSKDLDLIVIIADQTALILGNRALYHNLNDFYFEIVKTLIRTIDAKDHNTFNHSERTEQYAKLIAEKLNLSSEIVRKIEFAALVHDIGKVGIAGHILNKIERLTEDEKEVLKMHPIIGYNIIAPLTFLSSVAPIVLYHQEWYNGKGYPEGLSGEEIPLGARIISVIDAYDAMTSDRPYRKALGKEYAITELEKGKGTQFDPEVAKTFIDILKSNSTASKYRINKTI
ncbi:MAG: HD domain-containing protein [Endomicrobium sp.]|jgi:HD-GYP domain-containing protein (c-di-GMP phosphodiesterase class II)|nr:HD domain-containing protein [Endomicrobium sp.]MDR2399549.1 HD domain-containing protein [Endomicrobium sp.]